VKTLNSRQLQWILPGTPDYYGMYKEDSWVEASVLSHRLTHTEPITTDIRRPGDTWGSTLTVVNNGVVVTTAIADEN
jgi:hypothetical protein